MCRLSGYCLLAPNPCGPGHRFVRPGWDRATHSCALLASSLWDSATEVDRASKLERKGGTCFFLFVFWVGCIIIIIIIIIIILEGFSGWWFLSGTQQYFVPLMAEECYVFCRSNSPSSEARGCSHRPPPPKLMHTAQLSNPLPTSELGVSPAALSLTRHAFLFDPLARGVVAVLCSLQLLHLDSLLPF